MRDEPSLTSGARLILTVIWSLIATMEVSRYDTPHSFESIFKLSEGEPYSPSGSDDSYLAK
jgi:hypothetical protein